jgi:hypothetical protein
MIQEDETGSGELKGIAPSKPARGGSDVMLKTWLKPLDEE